MEKWLCVGSIGVAVLFLLLFMVDLFVGYPFGAGVPGYDSPFTAVDIGGILFSGILGYLAWNAFRDVK
jgi:hypothetical protein